MGQVDKWKSGRLGVGHLELGMGLVSGSELHVTLHWAFGNFALGSVVDFGSGLSFEFVGQG